METKICPVCLKEYQFKHDKTQFKLINDLNNHTPITLSTLASLNKFKDSLQQSANVCANLSNSLNIANNVYKLNNKESQEKLQQVTSTNDILKIMQAKDTKDTINNIKPKSNDTFKEPIKEKYSEIYVRNITDPPAVTLINKYLLEQDKRIKELENKLKDLL